MARPLRIEYPGAAYHVMARGNQGRAIFKDERIETVSGNAGGSLRKDGLADSRLRADGQSLSSAGGDARRQLGGGNEMAAGDLHTALQLAAPDIRASISRAIQGRGGGGADGNYLQVVSTYIHLNPARSGLIRAGREELKRYRWSSYPWYLCRPGVARPGWSGRASWGRCASSRKTAGAMKDYLEGRALEIGLNGAGRNWKNTGRRCGEAGMSAATGSRWRCGAKSRSGGGGRRESHSGAAKTDHSEHAAGRLLRQGLAAL